MKYYTYDQLAKELGVSVEYVRILKSNKKINAKECKKVGARVMVSETEVRRLVSLRSQRPGQKKSPVKKSMIKDEGKTARVERAAPTSATKSANKPSVTESAIDALTSMAQGLTRKELLSDIQAASRGTRELKVRLRLLADGLSEVRKSVNSLEQNIHSLNKTLSTVKKSLG